MPKLTFLSRLLRPLRALQSVRACPSHGTVLSYAHFGQSRSGATPIIIVHSLFETKNHWSGVARLLGERLQPDRPVIAVDLRNHGESEYGEDFGYDVMVADVDRLLGYLETASAILLGAGVGGMLAMAYALRRPEKVEKLIVQDICPMSYVDVEGIGHTIRALRKCRIPETASPEEAVRVAEACLAEAVASARVRDHLLMNLVRESSGKYVWKMNLKDIEHNLHNIVNFPKIRATYAGPTLFLASTDYHLTKSSGQDRMAAIKPFFPNAKVHVFHNCSTYIHLERTNDFLKTVGNFLRST